MPSKTLREAVTYFTGLTLLEVYGPSYRLKADITIADLLKRAQYVVDRENDVIRDQLARNHVSILKGTARFADEHSLIVSGGSPTEQLVSGETIVIAVGTRPARPPSVAFDGRRVIDTDELLVSPSDRKVIGVHIVGTSATEMVHIGQTVMALGGNVDFLVDTVFNHPTLSEAYKIAALDATNKVNTLSQVEQA